MAGPPRNVLLSNQLRHFVVPMDNAKKLRAETLHETHTLDLQHPDVVILPISGPNVRMW